MQLIGIINFKFMNKEMRIFTNQYSDSLTFPLLVGAAFGFGWTPCIGPILGSILTLAALDQLNHEIKGKNVICIISGSNNDIVRMEEIKERALLYQGLKHYFEQVYK